MWGCWSDAARWISRRNRSALMTAASSGGSTLITTLRPRLVSVATKTRLIAPPRSSRSST